MLAQEEQIKNTYEKCRSFSKGDYLKKKEDQEQYQLQNRLDLIKHKIIALFGKGGVEKSTVAADLASILSMTGTYSILGPTKSDFGGFDLNLF